MNQGKKDTFRTRVISTVFTMLALAVFKPFGLDVWEWMGYVHLLAIGVLGILCCSATEGIMKYLVHKPRSMEKGVDYIIRRNLWFQLINTPLVALAICLYRHFMMSDLVPANVLSWSNFLETLVIIAFCSFAIGLYWRFKFRSKYLAAELEETKLLNEQLQRLQQEEQLRAAQNITQPTQSPVAESSTMVSLTGTTSEMVTLMVPDLLYIETVGNYVKVYHLHAGKVQCDMLRATSKHMEKILEDYPMIVRCHRAFLINLHQVERIVTKAGSMQLFINHCNESIPVSRSNMQGVKQAIARSK